ncbi:MAG TPA: glutathione S-transferase N-terminal domain-containing protein, partial [Solimonas sp.]
MSGQYVLHGWHLSYFSGKTRAYLRYKGVPFDDHAVDALTLMRRIPAKTGAMVMPVVVTPEGEW